RRSEPHARAAGVSGLDAAERARPAARPRSAGDRDRPGARAALARISHTAYGSARCRRGRGAGEPGSSRGRAERAAAHDLGGVSALGDVPLLWTLGRVGRFTPRPRRARAWRAPPPMRPARDGPMPWRA